MSDHFPQSHYSPFTQPTEPQPGPVFSPPPSSRRGRKPGRLISGLIIGVALVLLCVAAVVSHLFLPASAATITFVPIHQSLMQSHTFSTADYTDSTHNQIEARQITFTTPQRTKRENTSSTGHLDATQATGHLLIVPLNANSAGGIQNMIIDGPNGIVIDTDESYSIPITPNTPTTVPAHVTKAGTAGNVPAYFLDADYSPGDDPGLILHISNPAPFTGGRNAYDGPMVQSIDIDQVEGDLTTQVQQEAQQGLRGQLHAGEGLLDLQCTPHVQSQSQSGIPGATVTASGSATCNGMAYDQQSIQSWVQNDMQQEANQRFGPHLGFIRQVHFDTTSFVGEIRIAVESDWAVQLDSAGKQALIQAIVGKSQDEAKNILSRQFSVQTTDITLSGWGLHLPTDPKEIQLVVHQGALSSTHLANVRDQQAGQLNGIFHFRSGCKLPSYSCMALHA